MQETETIEFKKSLAELGDGLNSMAAILNKHGSGELWFGIRNDGRPVGMDVSETTLRKVSQAIAAHIEPKIYPEVSKVILDEKSCIRIRYTGSEKPYYAHGRAYMRVADEDRQLSAKEIESIILRKNHSNRRWDAEPVQGPFNPDTAKLRAFVRRSGLTWSNAQGALESLGLYVDGHYLNAAIPSSPTSSGVSNSSKLGAVASRSSSKKPPMSASHKSPASSSPNSQGLPLSRSTEQTQILGPSQGPSQGPSRRKYSSCWRSDHSPQTN